MMRRIVYILVLLTLPAFTFGSENSSALFQKANAQYTKGNYKEAIQTYQSVLNGDYQSTVVYFNMGNAYYKSGDLPSALLYYEKAHKLAPEDADINFNIQLCNLKITDKVEPAPELFITKWWDSIILGYSLNTLAVLSVLFFLAGFVVLIYYLFALSVSLKKISFYASLVLIFFGLITLLLAVSQARYFASHHQAIVFGNSVTIKSEPGQASKALFVIHEGTKVDVLEDQHGWIRVKIANGNEGWMPLADAKTI